MFGSKLAISRGNDGKEEERGRGRFPRASASSAARAVFWQAPVQTSAYRPEPSEHVSDSDTNHRQTSKQIILSENEEVECIGSPLASYITFLKPIGPILHTNAQVACF